MGKHKDRSVCQNGAPLDATTPDRGVSQYDPVAVALIAGPELGQSDKEVVAAGGHEHPAEMTTASASRVGYSDRKAPCVMPSQDQLPLIDNPTSARARTSERVILDLCAGSGSWSKPYQDAGYTVIRYELEEGRDVRLIQSGELDFGVHGILAAPPCQHFSRAGAQHWESKGEGPLLDALSVLDACLRIIWRARPQWWVLENPVGRMFDYMGEPVMKFQPWQYGDPWMKNTWLWGEFNRPTENRVAPMQTWAQRFKGDHENRAITPPGFARAFFRANP